MNNKQILIIPDVHGRTFWKKAINKFPKNEFPNMEIIFLGDYLDPYTGYEDINKEQAYENFKEILEVAQNDERITLLIGNHDWHYFVNLDTCRIDRAHEREIERMFTENISRFRLHKVIELDDCKYLFSHAGITQKWLDDISMMAAQEYNRWNPGEPGTINYVDPEIDEDYKWIGELSKIKDTYNFELLEKCLQNYTNYFYTCPISMISRERGGWYPHGSLIWADVHEHINNELKEYYQIFGHTITFPTGPKDYAISPNGKCWAMLDASQAFVIDTEGNIKPLEKIE